jgi:hypothetical protein
MSNLDMYPASPVELFWWEFAPNEPMMLVWGLELNFEVQNFVLVPKIIALLMYSCSRCVAEVHVHFGHLPNTTLPCIGDTNDLFSLPMKHKLRPIPWHGFDAFLSDSHSDDFAKHLFANLRENKSLIHPYMQTEI